jgi:hypothetical protein
VNSLKGKGTPRGRFIVLTPALADLCDDVRINSVFSG